MVNKREFLAAMDPKNAGNYKLYKCRSLFACDSGGTVYDTSKRRDGTDYNPPSVMDLKCESQFSEFLAEYKSESQASECFEECESRTSECFINHTATNQEYSDQHQISVSQMKTESEAKNVIYIVDTESSSVCQKSQADSTTHLDDDEFNDYGIQSHNSETVQYVTCEYFNAVYSQIGGFNCSLGVSDKNGQSQFLHNNNSIVSQSSEHCLDSQNPCSINEDEDTDDGVEEGVLSIDGGNAVFDPEQSSYQAFVSSSEDTVALSEPPDVKPKIDEYEFDPSMKSEVDLTKKIAHKRKQTYHVKDDSFAELVDEDRTYSGRLVIDTSSSKSMKKKSAYNKENQKNKTQYLRRNPFANLKMSSILKENKKLALKKSKHHGKRERREPSAIIENHEGINSSLSSEEVSIYQRRCCSYANSSQEPFQDKPATLSINFSSEFTDADYFDYVQPRERIIESDMDKLLSPTVELGFGDMFANSETMPTDKPAAAPQVDVNGNEVAALSPNQMAERELFLKSAYAKKLGYENFFNTSNESVIDDLLFDQTQSFKGTKLDADFIKMSVEPHSNPVQFLPRYSNPSACTLIESVNEFNRFGDLAEDTELRQSLFLANRARYLTYLGMFRKADADGASSSQDTPECRPNFPSNLPDEGNFGGPDDQSKCDTAGSRRPASLKIKIKRVNTENNEYVIDSSGQNGNSSRNKVPVVVLNDINR